MLKIRVLKMSKYIMVFALLLSVGFALDANAYGSKTSRKNMVTVNVKPNRITPGNPVRFKVRISTHSVELADDMVSVSTLKDDLGREYRPVRWEGSPPGGHHRKGILVFTALEGNPKSITLVIRGIGNIPERLFEWKIEP